MITIHPVTPENILVFKAARLCALQDTPAAFGSTYARESQLTNAEWLERARQWDGKTKILYFAMDDSEVCGIAGTLLDQNDATLAHLISMWTAPTHRRRSIGRLLVREVLRWAGQQGARIMLLLVTEHNDRALRFYERLGFRLTGRTEPYPNDTAVLELEMSRPITEDDVNQRFSVPDRS